MTEAFFTPLTVTELDHYLYGSTSCAPPVWEAMTMIEARMLLASYHQRFDVAWNTKLKVTLERQNRAPRLDTQPPNVLILGHYQRLTSRVFKLPDEWYYLYYYQVGRQPQCYRCDQWTGLLACISQLEINL